MPPASNLLFLPAVNGQRDGLERKPIFLAQNRPNFRLGSLMSRKLMLSLFFLIAALAFSGAQTDPSAKQDVKNAGNSAKQAAKSTGKAIKKTTKKTAHTVKKTSKKAAHKTAQKTKEGVEKVEDKTE